MNSDKSFFGHPRGLATLFFTEMWERFSYYGMRALLLLFMVASIENGGMGMDEKTGGAIYGLYTMFVYLLALPGGWLADKFFGLRKSVFYGGCIIAMGHICLAFPLEETFFLGLFFIVVGTGMLKPTVSSLVGELYSPEDSARRDAGFTIFYMGINLGALISPIITGFLGQKINWHYGFAAAGAGMILGLIQYKLTENSLGQAGLKPEELPDEVDQKRRDGNIRIGLWIISGVMTILIALLFSRVLVIDPVQVAQISSYAIVLCAVLYFAYVFAFGELDQAERKKIIAIAIFFLATAIFYAGYEQQGSSLNLFADRYTDMFIGSFEMPASWLQSFPPVAVIIFSPVFAWFWVWLSRRKQNPATPVKISLGLIFTALGFAVMMGASFVYAGGTKPLPTWLIITYVLHTFGEICLYPVGLSAVTKLAPRRFGGQMMGIFFMSLAFGNLMAGLFAGEFDQAAIIAEPNLLMDLFGQVFKILLVAGLIVLLLNKPIRRLMGNIH